MSRRKRTVLLVSIAAVVAIALILLLGRLRPAAPSRIDLLTGPEGSAYHELGKRYAALLSRRGVTATVVVTKGAVDNLGRLAAAETPTVVFAETGVEHEFGDPAQLRRLVSLGSLAFEPVWLFVREDTGIEGLTDLRGRKIYVGSRGTGTRALVDMLLDANGLAGQVESDAFDAYTLEQILSALRSGSMDAAFLVASPSAPQIRRMLEVEEVEPRAFNRAKAYAALYPELARIVIPAGGLDLARNQPEADLELVAGATNLVSRDDLHAATVGLLLSTAKTVHRQSTLVSPTGTFPSTDYTSLPLSEAAEHYLENGPSGLSSALPYRIASLVDQLVFVVLPALLGLFAVLKSVPTFLNLRYSVHALRIYRRLAAIERRRGEAGSRQELLDEIAELDRTSNAIKAPLSKLAPYFELRQNIHDVQDRLNDPDLG